MTDEHYIAVSLCFDAEFVVPGVPESAVQSDRCRRVAVYLCINASVVASITVSRRQ